jgi:iron complex outermembrane receptor protein
VTNINTSSTIVPDDVVFDKAQELLIEKGQPQDLLSVSAMLDLDNWSVTGRMTHYGEVSTSAYGTERNGKLGMQKLYLMLLHNGMLRVN